METENFLNQPKSIPKMGFENKYGISFIHCLTKTDNN